MDVLHENAGRGKADGRDGAGETSIACFSEVLADERVFDSTTAVR
jgi:hypothetical protein